MAASESDSEILPKSGTWLPPNNGVPSSGPVGVVKDMRIRSDGGVRRGKAKGGRAGRSRRKKEAEILNLS